MALNPTNKKSRLDFAGAITEALGQGQETAEQTPVREVQPRPVQPEPRTAAAPVQQQEPAPPVFPVSGKKKFEKKRKPRGVQKSVYIDYEVYQRLDLLAKENEEPFSYIMNEVLKEYFGL